MATITTNCTFSNPKSYDNTEPTLKTHAFYWGTTVCTDNAATSTQNFIFQGYNPTTTIASSTDIKIYASFSAGEIMISLLLFLLIFIKLVEFIAKGLSNIKTKKKFVGYQGGDVEIREDI